MKMIEAETKIGCATCGAPILVGAGGTTMYTHTDDCPLWSTPDREIERVKAAVQRYDAAAQAIRDRIDEEGGPQSAHEHDAEWNAWVDKRERAAAWLRVLLTKRGHPEDLRLAEASRISAWP